MRGLSNMMNQLELIPQFSVGDRIALKTEPNNAIATIAEIDKANDKIWVHWLSPKSEWIGIWTLRFEEQFCKVIA
jgi:hypothetical protein